MSKGDPNPLPASRDEVRYAVFIINQEIRHLERIMQDKRWRRYVYATTYEDLMDAHKRFKNLVVEMETVEGFAA